MTFTAVGSNPAGFSHNVTTFSFTTHNVGNLIVCIVTAHGEFGGALTIAANCTAITSSRVTWTQASPGTRQLNTFLSGNGDETWTGVVFFGLVNSVGSDTGTYTWDTTYSGFNNCVAQEFTVSTGTWSLDSWTFLNNASGTATWPSLTPAASGELYMGFAWNQGSASSGTTSGYVYNASADTASNGMAYNLNCSAGTPTAPVWGDSSETYGIMALVSPSPPSAASSTFAAVPGRTWARRFHHVQNIPLLAPSVATLSATAAVAPSSVVAPAAAVTVTATAGVAAVTVAALAAQLAATVSAAPAPVAAATPAPAAALTAIANVAASQALAAAGTPVIAAQPGTGVISVAAPNQSVSTSGNTNAVAGVAGVTAAVAQPAPVIVITAGAAASQALAPAGLAAPAAVPAAARVLSAAVLVPAFTTTTTAPAASVAVGAPQTQPQHVPAHSVASVADPRDGKASVTALATSASSVTDPRDGTASVT